LYVLDQYNFFTIMLVFEKGKTLFDYKKLNAIGAFSLTG
jgi:hypothetical protein